MIIFVISLILIKHDLCWDHAYGTNKARFLFKCFFMVHIYFLIENYSSDIFNDVLYRYLVLGMSKWKSLYKALAPFIF